MAVVNDTDTVTADPMLKRVDEHYQHLFPGVPIVDDAPPPLTPSPLIDTASAVA